MTRLSYTLSEENSRRLDLLAAFATIDGRSLSKSDVLNECIRDYFDRAIAECGTDPGGLLMKAVLSLQNGSADEGDHAKVRLIDC